MKAPKVALDKELGQHFLTNKGVVEKIVQKVEYFKNREVVEVGPGGGALTEELLAKGLRVIAIEFDQRWYEELQKKFQKYIQEDMFKVIHADATRISFEEIKSYLKNEQITLCGNLPYNRGQEIVLRFFEEATFANCFVVMLQKEVIDKFLPKNERKCYGPLSIKMSFLADNLSSFFVSPGSFQPPPKVDSAVLGFSRKIESDLSPVLYPAKYKAFSKFLQNAFNQRRKKLSNNLKATDFDETFQEYASKRAEELSPEDFIKLFSHMLNVK